MRTRRCTSIWSMARRPRRRRSRPSTTSISPCSDLTEEFYLETVAWVFQEMRLPLGRLEASRRAGGLFEDHADGAADRGRRAGRYLLGGPDVGGARAGDQAAARTCAATTCSRASAITACSGPEVGKPDLSDDRAQRDHCRPRRRPEHAVRGAGGPKDRLRRAIAQEGETGSPDVARAAGRDRAPQRRDRARGGRVASPVAARTSPYGGRIGVGPRVSSRQPGRD